MIRGFNVVFRCKRGADVATFGYLVLARSNKSLVDCCAVLQARIAESIKIAETSVMCSPHNELYGRVLTDCGEKEIDWLDVQRNAPASVVVSESQQQPPSPVERKSKSYFLGYFLHSSDEMVERNVALIQAGSLEHAWVVVYPYMTRLYPNRLGFGIGTLLEVILSEDCWLASDSGAQPSALI